MSSASSNFPQSFVEIDVWLEAGREGRCFSYKENQDFSVDFGDLVSVRLRGRLVNGLVVGRRCSQGKAFHQESLDKRKNLCLLEIEALVQKSAVDPGWLNWIKTAAFDCYTSPFKMLKTALPPGWLGKGSRISRESKKLWWVSLEEAFWENNSLSTTQEKLKQLLLSLKGGSWQKDLNKKGFSYALIQKSISDGLLKREKRSLNISKISGSRAKRISETETAQTLTYEQKSAIQIFNAQKPGSALLLWGVTGSGKTEVYLQIASQEIAAGKHCLILAPEIGLIPQLVDRFKRRFGSIVFEYHSGCSDKEREEIWREILNAEYPMILVGTRSAIFLPLSPLGLIVLDEEHDSSYKQESPMPCYHARDLALKRVKGTLGKVILGSATPSLFTWKELIPNGPINIARLTKRISLQPLPKVNVVDMRQEFDQGHKKLISRLLMEKLNRLVERNEQAVVLVPRRGYSSFLSCRSCGEVVECPNCDVALTVHRGANGLQWLRCHWCDYRTDLKSNCDHCGSTAFKPFGAGTQKVMDHLSNELKGVRLLRFDRDTTGGRDGHRELLEKFASGEADVLIGTQMLAKGIDLPMVTLAVVLAADGLLHRPDLLASEQTLQLLMQLAGRAGRGERRGEVLVQTYCPDNPVINYLVNGQYEEFLFHEAKIRSEAGLVPFRRACLLRFSGESAEMTALAAKTLANQLNPICSALDWKLIGPAPSMMTRVAGKSRWQVLLHGPEKSPLPLPADMGIWESLPKGINLSVDPDPIQL